MFASSSWNEHIKEKIKPSKVVKTTDIKEVKREGKNRRGELKLDPKYKNMD